jgi:hypothetical protein
MRRMKGACKVLHGKILETGIGLFAEGAEPGKVGFQGRKGDLDWLQGGEEGCDDLGGKDRDGFIFVP